MSSEQPVTVQWYSDKNILVQGDYEANAKAMKRFQARWNPRLKSGPGWLVPHEFESAVRAYFNVHEEEPPAKYGPAPSSVRKAPAPPAKKPVPEPEPVAEEPEEEEPAPLPVKKPAASTVSKKPAAATVSKKPVVQEVAPDEDENDVKSLAKRMKDLMSRVDRLEKGGK